MIHKLNNYANKHNYYRGEIYYVEKSPSYCVGSETYGARPAIIVSNDLNNAHSDVVEVVYLTTSPKTDLPTHVKISSTNKKSIALCEQVWSVSKSRIGDFYGSVSKEEQDNIDEALRISLGLDEKVREVEKVELVAVDNSAELQTVTMERDMYKRMYDDLMTRIMTK